MAFDINFKSTHSLFKINPFDEMENSENNRDKTLQPPSYKIKERPIPIYKTTSFGNNFIIVDETKGAVLSEKEKSNFAFRATNINFGVGADNFIVIQRFNSKNMAAINSERRYWKETSQITDADFIFRMFEPDGTEAFSCGNGLMCVAHYLFARYGYDAFKIVTQIPTKNPETVYAGVKNNGMSSWANMGNPHRINPPMVHPDIIKSVNGTIDRVDALPIHTFWQNYGKNKKSFRLPQFLSGYLVFTGEPHFVIFTDLEPEFVSSQMTPYLFSCENHSHSNQIGIESLFPSANDFINALGTFIQKAYAQFFPFGININFVCNFEDENMIEYRCFERGIFKETLACGTGALASAYIAKYLNIIRDNTTCVLPYLSRQNDGHAKIHIESTLNGWIIEGSPKILFRGDFFIDNKSASQTIQKQTNQGRQIRKPPPLSLEVF